MHNLSHRKMRQYAPHTLFFPPLMFCVFCTSFPEVLWLMWPYWSSWRQSPILEVFSPPETPLGPFACCQCSSWQLLSKCLADEHCPHPVTGLPPLQASDPVATHERWQGIYTGQSFLQGSTRLRNWTLSEILPWGPSWGSAVELFWSLKPRGLLTGFIKRMMGLPTWITLDLYDSFIHKVGRDDCKASQVPVRWFSAQTCSVTSREEPAEESPVFCLQSEAVWGPEQQQLVGDKNKNKRHQLCLIPQYFKR